MGRETVGMVGNGNQTRPTPKNRNSTPGMVNRDTQKAILRPLG